MYRKQIPNLELDAVQMEHVVELSKEIGNYDEIQSKLEDLSINSMNYEAAVRKLIQMQGESK